VLIAAAVAAVAATPRPDPLAAGLRDAAIGLHILDVNIALDNLVHLVRDEASAYTHRRPARP